MKDFPLTGTTHSPTGVLSAIIIYPAFPWARWPRRKKTPFALAASKGNLLLPHKSNQKVVTAVLQIISAGLNEDQSDLPGSVGEQ